VARKARGLIAKRAWTVSSGPIRLCMFRLEGIALRLIRHSLKRRLSRGVTLAAL